MKLTDDEIEALAKKYICPHHDRLDAILPNRVPYQQTEQFRRVKALIVDVLSKLRAPVAVEKLDEGNAPMPFKDHSMGPLTPVHDYTGSLIGQTVATARHGAYEGSVIWMRMRRAGEWMPWHVADKQSAPVAGEAQPVAWGTTDDREPISDALKRAHPRYATAYTVPLFRYVAPKASEADPLQGAADWLVNAQEKFGPLDLSASLMIGYNRAQRLYDAAKKPKS